MQLMRRFGTFLKKSANSSPIRVFAITVGISVILTASLCFVLFKYVLHWDEGGLNVSLRLPRDKEYPLVNPLLLCNITERSINEDSVIEDTVKDFIAQKKKAGLLQDMSVYLINYKNGTWAGVGQNDRYDPASMLKVPVMIAYYQMAERNPAILSERITFNGDDQNEGQYFRSKDVIQSGKSYSIEELIRSMIIHSDNTALILLQNYAGTERLQNVYTDLGLPLPEKGEQVEYLSAKLYAYFFRVLYNATYLGKEYSQKALELLSQTKGIAGISKGVPEGTIVSEKFGERSLIGVGGKVIEKELHDCGLIYKSDSPYLLCVMSRGSDFDALESNMRDLSTLLYPKM